MYAPTLPDRSRQWANLVLAVGMPATTALLFGFGTDDFESATDSGVPPHAVIPAGYAFTIWGLIYAACVAYGAYQFRARERERPLLRRAGPWTAAAFLLTCAWLALARLGQTWGTVACIVGIAAALAGAFRAVARSGPLARADAALVGFPVSVFFGWVTVAVFANAASAVKDSGYADAGLPEPAWATLLVLAAGAVASAVTAWARGDAAYALTVVWAVAAIAAANVMMGPNPAVVVAAGLAAAAVLGTLVYARATVRPAA